MNPTKREIMLGILVGLAIGIPALIIALLLARSGEEIATGPSTATAPVGDLAFDTLPTQELADEHATPRPPGSGGSGAGVTPTAADVPVPGVLTHTVAAGETMLAIALDYDVSFEDLVEANAIDDPDFLSIGTVLTIPVTTLIDGSSALTATGVATDTLHPALPLALTAPPSVTVALLAADYPAVLEGDLVEAYPETRDALRLVVHYTPGTYPENDIDSVVLMLQGALAHIEATLDAAIEGPFDVYVAGSLFAAPDRNLRGRSFSAARRFFILHDGTGSRADQQYIATHEMTHLFTWNVFGRPVSAMLSEGAAVYAGMTAIADSDHMSAQAFCRAYQVAGQLPRISSGLLFEGHVRDLPNYYAAGCFVQYLVETYGTDRFAQLYPTGAYADVYGKTLPTLETEWRAALEADAGEPELDADALVKGVDDVAAAYEKLFAGFEDAVGTAVGTVSEATWLAYLELDAARMALMEGRLKDIAPHLLAAGY